MKWINVAFTDAEMKRLKIIKDNLVEGTLSWHDFILKLLKSVEDEK